MSKVIYLSKNFTLAEYACRCGCGYEKRPAIRAQLERHATLIMQPLRDDLGCRIHINSGARCPRWNTIVGGAPGSFHQKGMAGDFVPECSLVHAHARLIALPAVGGAHLYPTFIHGDLRDRVNGRIVTWA